MKKEISVKHRRFFAALDQQVRGRAYIALLFRTLGTDANGKRCRKRNQSLSIPVADARRLLVAVYQLLTKIEKGDLTHTLVLAKRCHWLPPAA